ncbi:MAG: hypothetical protein Q7K54_05810 [Candidatus Parcubacteria bacterium]|nr:hypothetical protein [Candidatus Parcubacteria bacterium]
MIKREDIFIHCRCHHCRVEIRIGENLISLSDHTRGMDGKVDLKTIKTVNGESACKRIFFHTDCFELIAGDGYLFDKDMK